MQRNSLPLDIRQSFSLDGFKAKPRGHDYQSERQIIAIRYFSLLNSQPPCEADSWSFRFHKLYNS